MLSDTSKRRALDHALRMAQASSRGSPSPFAASSAYGAAGYGAGGYGAAGYGAAGYGGYGAGMGGFGTYSNYGGGSDEDEGFDYSTFFSGRRYGGSGGAARGGSARGASGASPFARGGSSGSRAGAGASTGRYWGYY